MNVSRIDHMEIKRTYRYIVRELGLEIEPADPGMKQSRMRRWPTTLTGSVHATPMHGGGTATREALAGERSALQDRTPLARGSRAG